MNTSTTPIHNLRLSPGLGGSRSSRVIRTLVRGILPSVAAAFLAISPGQIEAADAPTPPGPTPAGVPTNAPAPPPSKFRDYNEVIEGTEKLTGLFTLYRTNETLYAELLPAQLNQPFIAPMAIARGVASAGQPLNFGDEWILIFKRVDDKIQLLRRNIHYKASENSPLQKAVQQNYTDSILMALPIVSVNPRTQAPLIDFGQIFLGDFANLGLGSIDRNRTSWSKIRTFKDNVELQVEATYTGRGLFFGFGSGDTGVADSRGLTLVLHYSLAKLPEAGYKPRIADQRVGYFIDATKDYGSNDPNTEFVRYVSRWRLEKSDPKAKLSPPKKQIVWWVEDTVPQEFRPYVEDGILEWNKAFEKIGFRNALAVRWQNDRDEFDPEDINYCTFRWITTSSTFAMSGLRSNPLTGEMIDGDVIFDASWIRAWKSEYAYLVGTPPPTGEGDRAPITPLAIAEVISPIMAAKHGYGLPLPIPGRHLNSAWDQKVNGGITPHLVPSDWNPLQMELNRRLTQGKFNACQHSTAKIQEFSLAAIALAQPGDTPVKLPEEFLGQAIKEVVMHEVGHSLGLRHNFKASSILKHEELNDPAITRTKGMSGSVMDYNPINIAPKWKKQGDFASTTIGPYDYWAIEYAYKPIEGDETAELKKIAARSPDPDLAYATDEDLYGSDDPLVNAYDLGNDPLKFGQERMALAADLLKNLDERVIREGESWARLRNAFSVLLNQYGNGAYLAAGYIGGQSISRDFKGGEGSRDPIVPLAGDRQREALKFLVDEVLSDKAFQFSPSVLRRLATERWYHWGSDSLFAGSPDYNLYGRVLGIQRIVLNQCFNGSVLNRIQNQELQSDPQSKPLGLGEIFRSVSEGVWTELNARGTKEKEIAFSTIRRNLQREHLRRLMSMVMGSQRNSLEDGFGFVVFVGGGGAIPADARSLARLHLTEIGDRINQTLENKELKFDDTTRAHLVESRQRITKTLDSSYTSNEF